MDCIGRTKKTFEVNKKDIRRAPDAENTEVRKGSSTPCIPCRYYVAILIFISSSMINGHRMALAIAVLSMSNYTSTPHHNSINSTSCPVIHDSGTNVLKVKVGGDFNWDSKLQGYILGASFLGSVLSPIFGGLVTDTFGAKPVIFWGTLFSAVASLLSPIVSWWNVYILMLVQFVRSAAQSCTSPTIYNVMVKWTPRKERGLISSFVLSGFYSGSLMGGPIAGYLCDTKWLGWQAVFYFVGGSGICYCILFGLTFHETPRDHPTISEAELKYITEDQVSNKNKNKPPTPWLKMFTSVPTYALMYGLVGRFWCVYYVLSVNPSYLGTILHYNIAKNGLISSLPFILQIISSLLASSFSDWLYQRKYLGVNWLRKGWTIIGKFGVSLSILGMYFAGCNAQANDVLLSLNLFFQGVTTPGIGIAAVDMTPNFASTLMGVIMTVCNVVGFIIPVMVGYMTVNQTLEEWQNVFLINIAVEMSSCIVFVFFGSAKVQPWNFVEEEKTMKEHPKELELSSVGENETDKDVNVAVTKM